MPKQQRVRTLEELTKEFEDGELDDSIIMPREQFLEYCRALESGAVTMAEVLAHVEAHIIDYEN